MRIKLCGIRNEEDLAAALRAGADAIGFQAGQLFQASNFILASTAGRLARMMPPYVTPVLVTHLATAGEIAGLAARAGIYTVQISYLDPDETARLRDLLPDFGRIIQTFYAAQPQQLELLPLIEPLVDAFHFDALHHDRETVETVSGRFQLEAAAAFAGAARRPVFLSGGLNAANLAEAIRRVRPFGVDVCGAVHGASGGVDACAARSIVRSAREAFYSLEDDYDADA